MWQIIDWSTRLMDPYHPTAVIASWMIDNMTKVQNDGPKKARTNYGWNNRNIKSPT